jgi:peroxiredoxin
MLLVALEDRAPRYAFTHFSPLVSQANVISFHTQRFAIVTNDDTIESVDVEEDASELTVTEASRVLAKL